METMEQVLDGDYEFGALSASPMARTFYAERDWKMWTGPLSAQTPKGVSEVTSEREIYVFDRPCPIEVDPALSLVCDWRVGDLW
jgi:aminoglycoside 2'-N-acetyltransferase I